MADRQAWPPSRIINGAASVGTSVGALVEHILGSRDNPETAYRSCMALIRSGKAYDRARFDAACRPLDIGSPTRKSVLAILSRGLDVAPLPDASDPPPGATHDNVRGAATTTERRRTRSGISRPRRHRCTRWFSPWSVGASSCASRGRPARSDYECPDRVQSGGR
jgi:hypothetical protein